MALGSRLIVTVVFVFRKNIGDIEALAKAEAFSVLEWESKKVPLIQNHVLESLKLYRSIGYHRFHRIDLI